MIKNPFFRIGLSILLVCSIVFMMKQVNFIFQPIIILVKTLSMPFIIAGVMYYLLLPAFIFLQKKGISKNLSILTIFGGLALIITSSFVFIGPIIGKQVKTLTKSAPEITNKLEVFLQQLSRNEIIKNFHLHDKVDPTKIASLFVGKIDDMFQYVGNNIVDIVSTVTDLAVLIVVVPFILYYLLKDGHKIPNILVRGLSKRVEGDARKILSEMNYAVCSYIQGQFFISFIVGFLKYIGFLIIGLNYSLLLGIISVILNMIPFAGPLIALIFAVAVGFTQSVKIGLLVVVIVIVAQQIADNFISPHILGNKLQIHPLTIILLLLFAGNLAGFMGLFLAVPVYAVLKVVVSNTFRIRKIKREGTKKHKTHPDYEEEIEKEV